MSPITRPTSRRRPPKGFFKFDDPDPSSVVRKSEKVSVKKVKPGGKPLKKPIKTIPKGAVTKTANKLKVAKLQQATGTAGQGLKKTAQLLANPEQLEFKGGTLQLKPKKKGKFAIRKSPKG